MKFENEKESLERVKVEDTEVLDISELEKISGINDPKNKSKKRSFKTKFKNIFSKKIN